MLSGSTARERSRRALLAGLVAIAPLAIADAQSMPGMSMPMPAAPVPQGDANHPAAPDAMGMAMPGGGAWSAGSGTARQPGFEPMAGLHLMTGDWMVMAHGYAWEVYSDQGGPRGDNKAFVESMAMLEASHPLGSAARLQLRGMVSLDPIMGERGYPNLLATGESAHGVPLVDRQHPHDFFMELSGRVDVDLALGATMFVYAGLPGEPALGPTTYMHRASDRLNPEAPIAHHWFDSTHITFGVVTAGLSTPLWQVEASAFNGREPNEERWGIDTPRLDSWSLRGTLTPAPAWAMEVSYGRLHSPEALHPGQDEAQLIASASYTRGPVAATVGWSRKDIRPGPALIAAFAEATMEVTALDALFGRVERVANDEWFADDEANPLADRTFHAAKFTLGGAHSLAVGRHLSLALGGSVSAYAKSDALDAAYGTAPKSFTLFAKLMLDR